MKKCILLFAVVILFFSACETVDFPLVDPPERLLKSLTDVDADKIFELTYQDGLVDSILIIGGVNRGSPKKFRVSYMDSKVTALEEFYQWGTTDPSDTLKKLDYRYTYTEEKIVIQDTLAFYPLNGRVLETTRTYELDADGELVHTIHVIQLDKRGDSVLRVAREYKNEYTWDKKGHNIIAETVFERPYTDPTAPYLEISRVEYTYDNNPNPFWGLMRPYFPAINDPVRYLSKNNVSSMEVTREARGGDPSSLTLEYTYGEGDFPETLAFFGTMGSNWEENLLFEYK